MRNFRKWEVWNNSKVLVKLVYEISSSFPDSEKFGITNQIRRAAVSIPANIAEGAGRNTEKDFKNFLHIAIGSSFELETLTDLCFDLGYIEGVFYKSLKEKINHVQRQLSSFISKL
jgi:four helix bundle protein